MRQLGRGPGNNLTHLQDVCRQAGEPCGETMGQLDCHTKPPSASRCATVQPDEYAPCNRTSQTVRRFAQTLMMYQRRTFLLLRSETFTEVAAQKCRNRRAAVIVLAGNLVPEEDRRLKKVKTGGPTCKARFRPDVAAAPPASPEPASATKIWIARAKSQVIILIQMLPFADHKCLRTFAAPESGVCALLDAAQRAA
jgi:hypothetical protein